MSVREQGLWRATALTTALGVAGVGGSLALATVARAHTEAGTMPTHTSITSPGSSNGLSGPSLTPGGDRAAHATSGGS
jgi:hypothetical protein